MVIIKSCQLERFVYKVPGGQCSFVFYGLQKVDQIIVVACDKPALGLICPWLVMEPRKNSHADKSRKDYSVDYPYFPGLYLVHKRSGEKLQNPYGEAHVSFPVVRGYVLPVVDLFAVLVIELVGS